MFTKLILVALSDFGQFVRRSQWPHQNGIESHCQRSIEFMMNFYAFSSNFSSHIFRMTLMIRLYLPWVIIWFLPIMNWVSGSKHSPHSSLWRNYLH